MTKSIFFSFGVLILFLLYTSCLSIQHPADDTSYPEKNPLYNNEYNSNEDDDIPMIHPKSSFMYRPQRSSPYQPRASRNSWFRVSSYQHKKPASGSEEKPAGDNLMRWG